VLPYKELTLSFHTGLYNQNSLLSSGFRANSGSFRAEINLKLCKCFLFSTPDMHIRPKVDSLPSLREQQEETKQGSTYVNISTVSVIISHVEIFFLSLTIAMLKRK
jgi:hypothetical protein